MRCKSAVSSGVRKNVSSASEGRSDHPHSPGESGLLKCSSSLSSFEVGAVVVLVVVVWWSTTLAKFGSASKRRRASYLYGYYGA